MNPKVTFFMLVFNDDYVLRECLESVLPYGPVVAAEGPVDYWQRQGFKRSTDETLAILSEYGIPNISGPWAEKDEMCRGAERLISSATEFVWVLDADEIWAATDIERIIDLLASGQWDSMAFKAISFYGGFDRYMTGFEEEFEVHRITRWQPGAHWHTHRPPTVLAPGGRPWRDYRHLSGDASRAMGLRYYHYSYVWPEQMARKAAYYHDRDPRGTIPDYMNAVYLPWQRNEASRMVIERAFQGVHNWLPERRGPCYTAPFEGDHPAPIARAMPRLRSRFAAEMARYQRLPIG